MQAKFRYIGYSFNAFIKYSRGILKDRKPRSDAHNSGVSHISSPVAYIFIASESQFVKVQFYIDYPNLGNCFKDTEDLRANGRFSFLHLFHNKTCKERKREEKLSFSFYIFWIEKEIKKKIACEWKSPSRPIPFWSGYYRRRHPRFLHLLS